MRLKLASWLCLALSFGVAQAQTPGTFAPNSQLGSTQLNAAFGAKANATNPVITGTLSVGGTGITGFGTGIGQALGPLINYQGTGRPGLFVGTGGLIFAKANPIVTDSSDFLIQRATNYSGGTVAQINSAFRVDTTVGANDNTQTWGTLSSLHSNNTSPATEDVASYVQSVRNSTSRAWMWGEIVEMTDLTGLASSAVGAPTLSQEIDLSVSAADDQSNPSKIGGFGTRHFAHYAANRVNPASNAEISTGLWFSTSNVFIDSLIGFGLIDSGGTQVRQVLDTRGAIPPFGVSDPVASVRMSAGQIIDFNGGATLTSGPGDYMAWDAATSKLKYYHLGVAKWSVDTSGNVRAAGTVTASVTP